MKQKQIPVEAGAGDETSGPTYKKGYMSTPDWKEKKGREEDGKPRTKPKFAQWPGSK